jgi:nitric oxide dioxygenase
MTPEQIAIVETTAASLVLDDLAADFYRRAFDGDPALADMFTTDPVVQRARFAAELVVIVTSIRRHDAFLVATEALGRRHRGYGVRAAHFRLMGDALIAALEAALGPAWTVEAEHAWRLAYNLTAETMMAAGSQC